MSRSRIPSILVSAFAMLGVTASWFPAEAQLGTAAERGATLRLTLGTETTDFEVTYCSVQPRESGQNHIEAELTAVGVFRGRPAALLLWKVTDAQFENIDLYLTELSADVRAMPPMQVFHRMTEDRQKAFTARRMSLETEFQENLARPDATMEEMTAISDAYAEDSAELDREFGQALPWIRYFGPITVEGAEFRFQATGQKSINPDEGVPEFAGLPDDVRVVAVCGS